MFSIARELNGITGSFFTGKEREGHWVGSKGRKDYSSSGPIQGLLSEVAKGPPYANQLEREGGAY